MLHASSIKPTSGRIVDTSAEHLGFPPQIYSQILQTNSFAWPVKGNHLSLQAWKRPVQDEGDLRDSVPKVVGAVRPQLGARPEPRAGSHSLGQRPEEQG